MDFQNTKKKFSSIFSSYICEYLYLKYVSYFIKCRSHCNRTLNPLAAELLYETKIYISHFSSRLNIQTANVNHISHKGRPEHA